MKLNAMSAVMIAAIAVALLGTPMASQAQGQFSQSSYPDEMDVRGIDSISMKGHYEYPNNHTWIWVPDTMELKLPDSLRQKMEFFMRVVKVPCDTTQIGAGDYMLHGDGNIVLNQGRDDMFQFEGTTSTGTPLIACGMVQFMNPYGWGTAQTYRWGRMQGLAKQLKHLKYMGRDLIATVAYADSLYQTAPDWCTSLIVCLNQTTTHKHLGRHDLVH